MPATTTRRPSGRRLAPPVRASHSVRTRACSANWTASRQQRFQVGAVQNRTLVPPNMRSGRNSSMQGVTVFHVLSEQSFSRQQKSIFAYSSCFVYRTTALRYTPPCTKVQPLAAPYRYTRIILGILHFRSEGEGWGGRGGRVFSLLIFSLPPCGVCRSPVPSVYSINCKRKKKMGKSDSGQNNVTKKPPLDSVTSLMHNNSSSVHKLCMAVSRSDAGICS